MFTFGPRRADPWVEMVWCGPQRSLPRQFVVLRGWGITPACFSAGDGDVSPAAIGVDVQNLGLLPRPAAEGVPQRSYTHKTVAAAGGLRGHTAKFPRRPRCRLRCNSRPHLRSVRTRGCWK